MAWVAKYVHDPNARLDYTMDWAATEDADGNPIAPYLAEGDTIIAGTATITTVNFDETIELTVDESSANSNPQIAWVQAVAAAPGDYLLAFGIETADGRKDERHVLLTVKPR